MAKRGTHAGSLPGGLANRISLLAGLAAPVFAVLGAFGASREILGSFIGFRVFALAIPLASIALIAAVVGLFAARAGRNPVGRLQGLAGITIAAVTLSGVIGLVLPTAGLPVINDISTDLQEPPEFVHQAALPENEGRDMSYPESFVSEQKSGYPRLATRTIALPYDEAFEQARQAVAALPNVVITDTDPESGRIEAMSTSRIFRFVDDLVVRVREDGKESTKVDIRSKSRDGRGDLGANAARIEAFFLTLQ